MEIYINVTNYVNHEIVLIVIAGKKFGLTDFINPNEIGGRPVHEVIFFQHY